MRYQVVSKTEEMISDLVVLGSRDLGEIFEERLNEIDKALARFDTVRGVTLGVNLEGKNEGNKEQRTARRVESTPKSVESNVENSADVKGTTQPRVQEENLVSVPIPNQHYVISLMLLVLEKIVPSWKKLKELGRKTMHVSWRMLVLG